MREKWKLIFYMLVCLKIVMHEVFWQTNSSLTYFMPILCILRIASLKRSWKLNFFLQAKFFQIWSNSSTSETAPARDCASVQYWKNHRAQTLVNEKDSPPKILAISVVKWFTQITCHWQRAFQPTLITWHSNIKVNLFR